MSTLNEDLEQIKYDEDNIAANKVARFCYTEQAYQDDDYEGVPEFDPSVEQNIPLANPDTLKTNATVLDRGFRSQASSLPRMLINHFFGRVSYNLNKAHDNLVSLITTIKSFIGQPNGIASLDENGRIPYSQLPESALNLRGDWDASTNTPELSDEMEGATLGDMYYVNVGGTVDFGHGEITFLPNDRVMYNQYNQWVNLSAGNVRKVNNKEPSAIDGNITISAEDINMTTDLYSDSLLEGVKKLLNLSRLGITWRKIPAQSGFAFCPDACVSYGFSAYYAVEGKTSASGTEGKIMYSDNGIDWSEAEMKDKNGNNLSANLRAPVAFASKEQGMPYNFAFVGTLSGKILCYKQDSGFPEFVEVDAPSVSGTDTFLYRGTVANGLAVMSSRKNIFYSTDGVTWSKATLPNDFSSTTSLLYSPTYTGSCWLQASSYGLLMSEDGMTNWHFVENTKGTNTDIYLWSSADDTSPYKETAFVPRGFANAFVLSKNGLLAYNIHNKSWSLVLEGRCRTIKQIRDNLVVTCNNKVYYSEDEGYSWTESRGLDNSSIAELACGGGVVIAISSKNYVSLDFGISFIEAKLLADSSTVTTTLLPTYANGVWLACSSSGVLVSQDGIFWNKLPNTYMFGTSLNSCRVFNLNDTWFIVLAPTAGATVPTSGLSDLWVSTLVDIL